MAISKIVTASITDNAVTAAKVPVDGLAATDIAANAIGASELANNAVDTVAIADDAVTNAKIGADAVSTTEIANDASINTSGNIATTGSGTLTVAGKTTLSGDLVPSTPLSNRNMIINGQMQVNQRAGTVSGLDNGNSGYHTCDRWRIQFNNADEIRIQNARDTTSPDGFSNSFRNTVTTAESAIAANEYFRISQSLEGQDLQGLAYGTSGAKTTTLSFYVRSSVAGTYGVSCYQYDGNLQQTHNYTITTANTWQRIELQFTGNTANAIANDATDGLKFLFYLMVGADFKGTASTTWSAYDSAKSAGLATAVWGTSTSHNFYLTGVQFEIGSSATPYEYRTYADELHKCHRYYYALSRGTSGWITIQNYWLQYNANYRMCTVVFPVVMRGIPSITITSNSAPSPTNYGVDDHQWKSYINVTSTTSSSYHLYTAKIDAEL